jgi:hypothetical protein
MATSGILPLGILTEGRDVSDAEGADAGSDS